MSQLVIIFGIYASRKTEDETKWGHEAATSPRGAGRMPVASGGGVAPSGAHRPRSFAHISPRDLKNSKGLITFSSTGPEPPPSPLRERSELLPSTLPGGGIVPGGFYVAMTASRLMCE